jgi:polygalacturonase
MKFFTQPVIFLLFTSFCSAASVYTVRLDDPAAVYLTAKDFHVVADGKADDSEAIQSAIDRLQETKGEGIVFIPEGRYRITRTIYL